MKIKRGIILLILLLIIPVVFSKTVSYDKTEIISADVFHCQPIYKGEKCLVDVSIQINNDYAVKLNPKFQVDFSEDYEVINFEINGNQFPIIETKSQFISQDKITLSKSNIISFQFWADKDGSFNLTGLLYNDAVYLGNIELDPRINITVNSTFPSYHLINGTNDVDSDDDYVSRIEISTELSDDDTATSYDVFRTVLSGNVTGIIDSLEFDTSNGQSPTSIKVEDSAGGSIYAVFYEGVLSDGFVSTYEVLNDGTINPVIDTFEFDIAFGITPSALKVSNNTYLVVYRGAGGDGFAKTIEILNDGSIIGTIETLEVEEVDLNEPNLFWLREDENIAGVTSSQMTTDGILGIGNISDNGSIDRISRFVFNDTQATEIDSINVSRNVVLLSYASSIGGMLQTVFVLNNGIANHTIDTEVFDSSDGDESHITYMGNDIYAVVYKDTGVVGTIKTFTVTSDGQVSSIIDEQIFEDENGIPSLIHPYSLKIADGILAIVSRRDDDNTGRLDLWNILGNGSIADVSLDSFTYDLVQTYRQEILHFKDDIYIITYEGDGNDGYITTVEITSVSEELGEDNALSVYFDYTINSSLFYWLEVWADSSAELTIHSYINGSGINQTNLITDSISSGLNRISIDSLIPDGYNLPYRLYTDTLTNISEVYLIEEQEFSPLTAYLVDYYALNSTGGRIDEFTTENLEEIEFMILNFTINISFMGEVITDWYFNFSMNGTNACALGNKQSSECFQVYEDEWVQFIDGQETDTFKDEGSLGDYISATVIGLGTTEINIVLEIDEHYHNVFKWYDAGFNFSDIKWQNDSNISLGSFVKIEMNPDLIPLDADQYMLDIRVTHNNPTVPLEAYLCNSTYATGHPHDFDGCSLVMKKFPYEIDETQFRGIFTKDLIDGIGDIKYVVLELHTNNSNEFFAIKTYRATNLNHTIKWEYSDDYGATWNPRTDYESEANINWFNFDGMGGESAFIYNIYAESNTTSTNLIGNVSWDIDPVRNYPPLVNIERPIIFESITQPYLIEFNIDDPNTDTLNSSLYLDDLLIAGDLNYSSSYYWDSFVNESTYDLMLLVCEMNTTELFCSNHTIEITIRNFCDEDISAVGTPLEDCNDITLTQNVSYVYIDSNFATCCNVTGLGSDCGILNTTLYANYTQVDDCSTLDCLYDSTPYLKFFDRRIPLMCEVNKNASYDFLTYVKADDEIIQTNPERELIDRYGEYNSFRSLNGVVNLYYRSDNLRPDRNITVIIEGQNGIFYQELNVTPTYKDPYQMQDRLFWTWDNAGVLLGGFFIILIIVVILALLFRHFMREAGR